MKLKSVTYVVFLYLYSCKTGHETIAQSGGSDVVMNKMACRIKGQIIKIETALSIDNNDVCARNPCVARVRVLEVRECSQSISNPVQQSDTLNIKFIYTLSDTRKLFPGMKARYPGMKKGNIFFADVEQRLRPGTSGEFVIYGYTVEK